MSPTQSPDRCMRFAPMFSWWSGFDYVFGYQMKLVADFWGLGAPDDQER